MFCQSFDIEWRKIEQCSNGGRNDVGNGPKGLHDALAGSEHYRLLMADRIQRAMFHGGILTEEDAVPIFQARVDEIAQAVRAESARWGDNRVSAEYTRSHLMNNFEKWPMLALQMGNRYWPIRVRAKAP